MIHIQSQELPNEVYSGLTEYSYHTVAEIERLSFAKDERDYSYTVWYKGAFLAGWNGLYWEGVDGFVEEFDFFLVGD